MILAAALLVLVALGLFVGGVVTGVTTLYWACVGVSAGAAVLLVLARRQLSRPGTAEQRTVATTKEAATSTEQPATAAPTTATATAETAKTETTAAPAAPAESEPPPAEAAEPAPSQPVARAADGGASDGGADGGADGEPPVEEVEVTDLLLVVDLHDEVLVIDEHPRYHLAGCPRLAGRETIPLPVDEARQDGFTPCGDCTPDRHLADAERARRASGRAP